MPMDAALGPSSQSDSRPEEVQINMEAFRQEIAGLIAERQKQKKDGVPINMGDLLSISPEGLVELTEEDASMWNRVKNYKSDLTIKSDIKAYGIKAATSKNPNRANFFSAISNRLQSQMLNEQLEEAERRSNLDKK